jgi:hypothetical protein
MDALAAEVIEHFQQSGGAYGGRACQAAQPGDTGPAQAVVRFVGQGLGQQRAQEAAGDGQADALGLGDARELGQRVGIDAYGLLQLAAQRSDLGTEAIDLVPEILELPLGRGALDGLEDFRGVAVERLPAEAGALGLVADGAVGSIEDGGGVGDAQFGG